MNILGNMLRFYEVHTDNEANGWSGREERKTELARKCCKVNTAYIQRQLERVKKVVSLRNVAMCGAIENELYSILKKYSR